MSIKIKVTKEDLEKYEGFAEDAGDYPLYAATHNLTRSEIVLLAKLMKYEFGNKTELEVTIKVKEDK